MTTERENRPAGNGAAPTRSTDAPDSTRTARQIPPVGTQHPTAGVLFIGALLWSEPTKAAAAVLELVTDSDMSTPSLAVVLSAVRRLVTAGTPASPQLVLDALRREGTLKNFACKDLEAATTSGAEPLALREYAAAVVADALRRRIASAGVALTTQLTAPLRSSWRR
jgi:replicative DNA helicase